MLVVADTGPLRYLIEVETIDVLPRLYGQVLTTPQVIGELGLPHFPDLVRAWANRPPTWLRVTAPAAIQFVDRLHEGEASALSLACECSAGLVLIDDRDGDVVARDNGLETLGTLGVLREAGAREYLDFDVAIQALGRTRFRCTPQIIDVARRQCAALRNDLRAKGIRTESKEP